MLYNDDAVIAMMAGIAYLLNNFPTFSVPNKIAPLGSLIFLKIKLQNCKKNTNEDPKKH